jgi:hypothetical protein
MFCAVVILALPTLTSAQTKTSGTTDAPATMSGTTQSAEPTKSTGMVSRTVKTTRTAKPMKGYVINLMTMKRVNAAEATAMANKSALAFMVGSRAYYVLKSDGTSAGDDLARLADASVGIKGRSLTKSYISVIMADMIETMK